MYGTNRVRRRLLLGGVAAASLPQWAWADEYPSKPIRVVVPWSAGGVSDVVARRTCGQIEKILGQPIVIENRGGAQGQVGTQHVARAAPDGYTLIRADNTCLVLAPGFSKERLYDPLHDLAPISLDGRGFQALLVPPSLGVRSLSELVDLAKAKPGTLNYGAVAPGAGYLVTERLKQLTGTDIRLVTYKGDGPVLTDLIAGHIQVAFLYSSVAHPFVTSGKLVALMVTGEKRAPTMPDAPTAREAGFPQLELYGWGGYMAPRGTPRAIIDKFSKAVVQAMQSPISQKALLDSGSENMSGTPEQFAAYLKADTEKWMPIIQSLDFKQ